MSFENSIAFRKAKERQKKGFMVVVAVMRVFMRAEGMCFVTKRSRGQQKGLRRSVAGQPKQEHHRV
jgi:hypothetical protein